MRYFTWRIMDELFTMELFPNHYKCGPWKFRDGFKLIKRLWRTDQEVIDGELDFYTNESGFEEYVEHEDERSYRRVLVKEELRKC
jgi:hypothetical protein